MIDKSQGRCVMASIVKKKSKKGVIYVIQLSSGENAARPKISLGKVTKAQANTARINIQNLIKSKDTGETVSPAVADWLNGISDGLRGRLERLNIVEPIYGGKRYTVEKWVNTYIQSRPDVKDITKGKWQNAANKLAVFFRGDYIDEVTANQAKNFRIYLSSKMGLAENTVRRLIGLSRQFFNAAIEAGYLTKNPFVGQSVAVRANPARFFYVTHEMSLKVLNACPDTQWRLIFGLARWGGLRCPSEVLKLRWQDIDFENERFTVHAIKTEHHADSGIRIVPIFPELKTLFHEAFEKAKDGDIYCINRYSDTKVNLRTHLNRIIKRAGLEPWPKLFQNLRSTRETELFRKTGGNVKAVCTWLGNSPEIALQHYAQVTEEDIQEAAKMSLLEDAEKRVQNRVLTTIASSCTDLNNKKIDSNVSPYYCNANEKYATLCNVVQKDPEYPQGDSNPCYRDENPAS